VLLNHKRDSPLVLVRLKSEAVLLASRGVDADTIGFVVERAARTVKVWLRGWGSWRLASVVTGHAGNENAALLTSGQKAEIAQVLASPPSQIGLPASFWDVPTLKSWVSLRFDVVYESDSSYHLLLGFAGLSFKYPDTFDRKRDEAGIEARMDEICQEIAPLLGDDAWEVFACDEVRTEHEAETRRAWLPRGQRTIVKVDRKKDARSWFGALNQKTGRCEVFGMDWQDTDNVIAVLTRLIARHPGKKLAIVWDNAAFHRSKALRDLLGPGNLFENLRLIAMPPYAPDHNPVEKVWNAAKGAIANIQRDTPEQTYDAFATFIGHNTFPYTFNTTN